MIGSILCALIIVRIGFWFDQEGIIVQNQQIESEAN
ncbi:hypothetical protein C499_18394 [Halogeometricum borinquense DSM 11551]|uniref:Uncharacterized protein n=1 Tax=Halogeometricum borinquense (strain ATCC 700274 / DSM 11551 / JCM 10706 / KCTC 4070 / PR3) TaxID=469382 RepID=E4NP31_HALBP|nr:hypothetical protein Hbor_20060 [Halogeometricum borinquense DSM 11551]ELY23748.1 hypothetical protein C499_18394 [Halogeometricum borinquense DSM 11551]